MNITLMRRLFALPYHKQASVIPIRSLYSSSFTYTYTQSVACLSQLYTRFWSLSSILPTYCLFALRSPQQCLSPTNNTLLYHLTIDKRNSAATGVMFEYSLGSSSHAIEESEGSGSPRREMLSWLLSCRGA